MIYLASPYKHHKKSVQEARVKCATLATAELIKVGAIVYSPLLMSIPVDILLPVEYDWYSYDLAVLSRCTELTVLTLPGWEQSHGVRVEREFAYRLELPVNTMQPTQEMLHLLKKAEKEEG